MIKYRKNEQGEHIGWPERSRKRKKCTRKRRLNRTVETERARTILGEAFRRLVESEIDCSAITIRCTQPRRRSHGEGRTLLSCRRNICEYIFPDIEADHTRLDRTARTCTLGNNKHRFFECASKPASQPANQPGNQLASQTSQPVCYDLPKLKRDPALWPLWASYSTHHVICIVHRIVYVHRTRENGTLYNQPFVTRSSLLECCLRWLNSSITALVSRISVALYSLIDGFDLFTLRS